MLVIKPLLSLKWGPFSVISLCRVFHPKPIPLKCGHRLSDGTNQRANPSFISSRWRGVPSAPASVKALRYAPTAGAALRGLDRRLRYG